MTSDYDAGYLAGLEAFAWNKDGALWVGTTGTTLAQAKREYLIANDYGEAVIAALVPETSYERWLTDRRTAP